jgi:VanZ family protein
MKNNVRIILLVFWIIVIFVLTGYPSLKTPKIEEFPVDKLYHFLIFFILGIFEYRLLKTYLFFLLGCSVVIIAELQQLLIPGRDFEMFDIFAGVIGLLIAYIVFKWRSTLKNEISKT